MAHEYLQARQAVGPRDAANHAATPDAFFVGLYSVISFLNSARAFSQSRSTLRTERPLASLISATVSPAK